MAKEVPTVPRQSTEMPTKTIVAALLALSIPTIISAQVYADQSVLQRVGKWQLNYDGFECDLSANFVADGRVITAQFTRFVPDNAFEVILFGKEFESINANALVRIKFNEDSNPLRANWAPVQKGELKGVFLGRKRLDDFRHKEFTADDADSFDRLFINVDSLSTILNLGSMKSPLQALNKCTDELVKSWGYDPQQQASFKQNVQPKGNPAFWATGDDYPPEARAARSVGMVGFRLDIDPDGSVTECHPYSIAASALLQSATCKLLMKRAQFTPARDANNKPIRSFYVNYIGWDLPSR